MSTTIKHVRMAPKGAKPTNPKYTLTLTRDEILLLRFICFERYFSDTTIGEPKSETAISVYKKIDEISNYLV